MKKLLMLCLLSGCCDYDNITNCTVAQKEKLDRDMKPTLVLSKDNVNLYYIPAYNVWFTTPCGGVEWTTMEWNLSTKTSIPHKHQTTGEPCK